jgi:hypothetical protein
MASGRRKESRLAACIQAALVWSIGEFDVETFVAGGAMESPRQQPMDGHLRANVDRYIDQYMTTGRIVVEQ